MCCGRGRGASAATEQAVSTGRARAASRPAAASHHVLVRRQPHSDTPVTKVDYRQPDFLKVTRMIRPAPFGALAFLLLSAACADTSAPAISPTLFVAVWEDTGLPRAQTQIRVAYAAQDTILTGADFQYQPGLMTCCYAPLVLPPGPLELMVSYQFTNPSGDPVTSGAVPIVTRANERLWLSFAAFSADPCNETDCLGPFPLDPTLGRAAGDSLWVLVARVPL